MDLEEFRRKMQDRAQAAASRPPLDEARGFLRHYWSDALDAGEVRRTLERRCANNPDVMAGHLRALDAVLASPPADGELTTLVVWDGNVPLEPPTDEAAAAWLAGAADMLRSVLAGRADP